MENIENREGANAQLQGFELKSDVGSEQLAENYEALFNGVESADIDEFRNLLEQAPDDIKKEVQSGDTSRLYDHVINVLKWTGKKAEQLIVFALVSAAASPALGAEVNSRIGIVNSAQELASKADVVQNAKESMLREFDSEIVSAKEISLGRGVVVSPAESSYTQEGQESSGNISINGKPGRVIFQDRDVVVYGNEDSVYEKNSDGSTVSVGTVSVER